ncbi:primosomal protein N' [Alkaliphilus metalliredigens QYMF]|uniref:Replication restart protein PriA n=1 Tax=Alkaliphilus metalliredigens (strain QYMF) TaxID=293826 RepID=A6TRW9_ALKMQ|nr:primosomal protein N' [Alkaliphilus metalliredigens]ABR48937.1 primosomal protein N' [Alkaliphilus metalliredigens QYMF]
MESKLVIAQVIVDHKNHHIDKAFDYGIPDHLLGKIQRGMRVLVPFGNGNKKLEAYVLKIMEHSGAKQRLKKVIELIDQKPILREEQMKLIQWIKQEYLCKYIEAIHCIVPRGMIHREEKMVTLINDHWRQEISTQATKQLKVLEALEAMGGKTPYDKLNKALELKDMSQILNNLSEKGLLDLTYEMKTKVKIKTETYMELKIDHHELERCLEGLKNAKKQKTILLLLKEQPVWRIKDLMIAGEASRATINTLIEKGMASIYEKEVRRDPLAQQDYAAFPKFLPNEEQKGVIDEITQLIKQERRQNYLLHGITGSGKTEIYLQLIEEVNRMGKQGIVLVPEIVLTPQTIERFKGRFGDGIAVLHSHLSDGERFDEWRRIQSGEVNTVIGARSAIFAPLQNLGLIIIDEEHEHTYKSEQNPKYHAVEVAKQRGVIENAIVILGSATPSVEDYSLTENEETIKLMTLNKRATQGELPPVEIVDMREELDEGNKSILSKRLHTAIEENLEKRKQTILFLNRRGYSTFISCRQCGYVVKCKHCDISMTYHMASGNLQCHYCGESLEPPRICPECSSSYIKYFGTGTQKMEKIVQQQFSKANVERMDLDTTSRKGSHGRILERFKKGEIDILIGTQMIAKGLDFPNVTLVGIVSADMMLNFPDFRASEKTFQLITQVAGRAGRGLDPGVVILQTYDPDHYSILAASKHDYRTFYEDELMIRKAFGYPPFNKLINLNFSGVSEMQVITVTKKIVDGIKYILNKKGFIDLDEVILGPNPSVIGKINRKYRYQVILKDQGVPFILLKKVVKYLLIDQRQRFIPDTIHSSIDINPYSML